MIITNKQTLYRAIADTFVKRKKEIMAMLQKHGYYISNDMSTEEVVSKFNHALENNSEFINEFSVLVAKDGYVNAGGDKQREYKNADGDALATAAGNAAGAGASGGPVGAIASAIGSIFGFFGSRQESTNIENQTSLDRENNLMNLIAAREAKAGQGTKTATYITLGVLGVLGLVVAVAIYSNRRKSATK